MHEFDPLGLSNNPEDLGALGTLVRKASGLNKHPVLVEVGSWVGLSAMAILRSGGDHFQPRLFCVDTWEGSSDSEKSREDFQQYGKEKVLGTFCQNLKGYLHHEVFPLVGSSQFWARHFFAWADLVFLDADHRYECLKEDILAWRKVLRPGGILCGHDYNLGPFPGVKQAVDELLPWRERAGRTIWWTRVED